MSRHNRFYLEWHIGDPQSSTCRQNRSVVKQNPNNAQMHILKHSLLLVISDGIVVNLFQSFIVR